MADKAANWQDVRVAFTKGMKERFDLEQFSPIYRGRGVPWSKKAWNWKFCQMWTNMISGFYMLYYPSWGVSFWKLFALYFFTKFVYTRKSEHIIGWKGLFAFIVILGGYLWILH